MTAVNSTENPPKLSTDGDRAVAKLLMDAKALFGGVRRTARGLSDDHRIVKEVLRAIADRGQGKITALADIMEGR